jgi:hypothetical protein
MDEHVSNDGTMQQQALRDRYPPDREGQDRAAHEDLRALRQGLRELSDVISGLVTYLLDISAQADAGNTGEEPQNREQLRVLREEVDAIRERLPEERQ